MVRYCANAWFLGALYVFIFLKGEVQVRRLHLFQTVWNLPPPKETSTVRGMAWRPDGKALAIGYSCGRVCIVDVEDKESLHSFSVSADNEGGSGGVTCVAWGVQANKLGNAGHYNIYDDANLFLPTPPPLNSGYKNKKGDDGISDFKQLHEQNQLNMLIVGYGNGRVHLSIFGRFPCGVIDLHQLTNEELGEIRVTDVQLSNDFSTIQVFYVDTASNALHFAIVHTAVLSAYSDELFALASKHSHIVHFLSYVDQTMVSITEAWEHILLEMDTKMAAYASNLKEGGVSADLLELLMMGVPSEELEIFLLQELTAKGLKKFGTSVELSYSTIQKLVLKQLNIVGQSLVYYLAELRGLARIPDRYKVLFLQKSLLLINKLDPLQLDCCNFLKMASTPTVMISVHNTRLELGACVQVLGLEEVTVTTAIRASCAFLNKCLELQQVIDLSMRNYKAFFRWLFVVIVRLLEEQTPSEIVKITQQELTYIAEFLYNFDNVQPNKDEGSGSKKQVRFNLERLAQYLQNEELSILPDDGDNPWHKFLNENKCLVNDSETIISISEFRKYSLVMQQEHLKRAITNVFEFSEKIISGHYSLLHNLQCHSDQIFGSSPDSFRLSQMFQANQKCSLASFTHLPSAKEGLCFLSVATSAHTLQAKAAMFYFSPEHVNDSRFDDLAQSNMIVSDIQFYSADVLSVLLQHPQDDEVSVFVQFPVKAALENCAPVNLDQLREGNFIQTLPRVEASRLLDLGVFKVIDKMAGHRIAVSGGRKVAVVLSKSCRKVKVFDMEVDGEEEDEETLDTTPQSHTTQRSDASQGTSMLDNSGFNSSLNRSPTD